jgi:hypothetical protein
LVLDIDEKNLKHGVLGLVIAVVEVIRDALRIQATKRMESGSLSEGEIERLGEALIDIDAAIEEIKKEQGLGEAVHKVREGLDDIVNEMLDTLINIPSEENEDKPSDLSIYKPKEENMMENPH